MEITVVFNEDDFKKLLLFLAYMSIEKSNGVDLFGAYHSLDEVAKKLDIDSEGRSDWEHKNRTEQEND